MTPAQCRAARELLAVSRRKLLNARCEVFVILSYRQEAISKGWGIGFLSILSGPCRSLTVESYAFVNGQFT